MNQLHSESIWSQSCCNYRPIKVATIGIATGKSIFYGCPNFQRWPTVILDLGQLIMTYIQSWSNLDHLLLSPKGDIPVKVQMSKQWGLVMFFQALLTCILEIIQVGPFNFHQTRHKWQLARRIKKLEWTSIVLAIPLLLFVCTSCSGSDFSSTCRWYNILI